MGKNGPILISCPTQQLDHVWLMGVGEIQQIFLFSFFRWKFLRCVLKPSQMVPQNQAQVAHSSRQLSWLSPFNSLVIPLLRSHSQIDYLNESLCVIFFLWLYPIKSNTPLTLYQWQWLQGSCANTLYLTLSPLQQWPEFILYLQLLFWNQFLSKNPYRIREVHMYWHHIY